MKKGLRACTLDSWTLDAGPCQQFHRSRHSRARWSVALLRGHSSSRPSRNRFWKPRSRRMTRLLLLEFIGLFAVASGSGTADARSQPAALEILNRARVVTMQAISWVRWPQQAILRATVDRVFARWYVRNFIDWSWQCWQPSLHARRVLFRRQRAHRAPKVLAADEAVILRPVARLGDQLAVCDWVVATYLGFRIFRERSPRRVSDEAAVIGASAVSLGYCGVLLCEAIDCWGRDWRRAAPIRQLFGSSPRERLLATYAHRLAASNLRKRRVPFDVPSLLGLSWRLGLAGSCLRIPRRAKMLTEDESRALAAEVHTAWACIAVLLKLTLSWGARDR